MALPPQAVGEVHGFMHLLLTQAWLEGHSIPERQPAVHMSWLQISPERQSSSRRQVGRHTDPSHCSVSRQLEEEEQMAIQVPKLHTKPGAQSELMLQEMGFREQATFGVGLGIKPSGQAH